MKHRFCSGWSVSFLSVALLAGCKAEPPAAEPAPAVAPLTVGVQAPAAAASAPDQPRLEPAADGRPSARKVLRKAELTLEVAAPDRAELDVTAIAERAGGYVASSSREIRMDEGARALARVTLTLRVPASELSGVLADVKHLGLGSASETLGSDDVTDEYIDLEARLKNQRALEDEFRELLKRASTVEDALKVQQQLASVRTEIDKLEGRRRFLDQESALSTITLTLSEARPLVAATPRGFGVSVRAAFSDSLDVGAALIFGAIRLVGVLLPLGILLGLPFVLGVRWLRRAHRARPARISG